MVNEFVLKGPVIYNSGYRGGLKFRKVWKLFQRKTGGMELSGKLSSIVI